MSESAIKREPELQSTYISTDVVGLDLDSDRDNLTVFIEFMENNGDTANLEDIVKNLTTNCGPQIYTSLFSLLPYYQSYRWLSLHWRDIIIRTDYARRKVYQSLKSMKRESRLRRFRLSRFKRVYTAHSHSRSRTRTRKTRLSVECERWSEAFAIWPN